MLRRIVLFLLVLCGILFQPGNAQPIGDFGTHVGVEKFVFEEVHVENPLQVVEMPRGPPSAEYDFAGGAIGAPKGTFFFDQKIASQMGKRGWNTAMIKDVLSNPASKKATMDTRWDKALGGRRSDPATAFLREDGHYVVRNDKTSEIVQISNLNDKNWISPW